MSIMQDSKPAVMLAVLALSVALAVQTTPAQDTKALEAQGQELLGAKCARCHAILRSGDSPQAAAPAFRTLSRRYPIEGLAESLAEGLSVGHSDMPEFVFEPDEIAAILAYLKSIQER
jgi:cytochrome c